MIISAMPSTTRLAVMAAIPAMGGAARRCSPTWDRWRSGCRGTGTAASSRKLVAKHQRRLPGVEDLVISLSAKGLTTGEICAHLSEVYGAQVSKQTISTITDRVLEGMAEWQSRPLDAVYPVLFIDCVNVKIRDGNVANRPIYVALAVTVDGTRDILGLWAGEHGDGEGAKYWLRVLSEIKNRGVADVCLVVCDGLKGLPAAIETVWPAAITQTCVVHLLRASFGYASRRDWSAIAKDLKPVYTAVSEQAALEAFMAFTETWQQRYPAIIRLWENAWAGVRAVPAGSTPRFAPWCARPTRSSRSTRASAEPSTRAVTSPPSRPRSSASIWRS